MKKLNTIAEVYKGDVNPDDWVVWALDPSGDGGMYVTVFSGIDAERRATEYARAHFREVQRHEPDQR